MSPIDIWVPWIGIGTDDDPCRADVPSDVGWDEAPHGMPDDLINPKSLKATTYINITLRKDTDLEKCTKRKDIMDIPESDRLLVIMLRRCEDKWDIEFPVWFDSIPNILTSDAIRKPKLKYLILHAVTRGLSVNIALQIAAKYDLISV